MICYSEISQHMKVFTGRANPFLAQEICWYLDLPLGRADVGRFPNGEIRIQIEERNQLTSLKKEEKRRKYTNLIDCSNFSTRFQETLNNPQSKRFIIE